MSLVWKPTRGPVSDRLSQEGSQKHIRFMHSGRTDVKSRPMREGTDLSRQSMKLGYSTLPRAFYHPTDCRESPEPFARGFAPLAAIRTRCQHHDQRIVQRFADRYDLSSHTHLPCRTPSSARRASTGGSRGNPSAHHGQRPSRCAVGPPGRGDSLRGAAVANSRAMGAMAHACAPRGRHGRVLLQVQRGLVRPRDLRYQSRLSNLNAERTRR